MTAIGLFRRDMRDNGQVSRRGLLAVAVPVLGVTVLALLLAAPTAGDFWWFEAPSHAMNGVFIRDLLINFPINDPVGWAIDYYLQYPALTILFYPPLFYVFEAVFFLLFGVSHVVAVTAVLAFAFFFALAVTRLASLWLPPAAALAVGIASLALPEIALWSRQVMLEVPAYCFAAWGLYFAAAYAERGLPRHLWLMAACLIAALYIKQTAAFFVVAALLALVAAQGLAWLRRRHVWLVAAVAVIALVPLAAISLKFGQFNAQLASGGGLFTAPIGAFAVATGYAQMLPAQVGWMPLALSVAALVYMGLRDRLAFLRPAFVVSALSFGLGYLFFTLIDLKDQRYTIFILAPFALLSVAAIHYLMPPRWAPAACLAYAVALFGWTLAFEKVPSVAGFREAAERAIATATPGSTVMFHGQRSAAFVFNLRALGNPTDLWTLRAEKLLVSYRQDQSRGYREYDVTAERLRDAFYRYGATCVVADSGFWTNLANVRLFLDELRSERFALVDEVTVKANLPVSEKSFLIYRNTNPVAEKPEPFALDMPLIGSQFSGRRR